MFYSPSGSLRKSKKSTVFQKDKINTESPSDVHAFIADGMFIVRSLNNLKKKTFSLFARSILTKLLKCTKYHLDLCFDVYESPSIKDVTLHLIPNNPYRPILKLFFKFQNINHNLQFLMKEYEDEIYSHIIVEKIVSMITSAKDFIIKIIITKLS